MNNADLLFIAGDFSEREIPKEVQFLYKYFKTPTQKMFLKYWYSAGTINGFQTQTGYRCDDVYKRKMLKLMKTILAKHKEAKDKMDIELVWKIENGEYKF